MKITKEQLEKFNQVRETYNPFNEMSSIGIMCLKSGLRRKTIEYIIEHFDEYFIEAPDGEFYIIRD